MKSLITYYLYTYLLTEVLIPYIWYKKLPEVWISINKYKSLTFMSFLFIFSHPESRYIVCVISKNMTWKFYMKVFSFGFYIIFVKIILFIPYPSIRPLSLFVPGDMENSVSQDIRWVSQHLFYDRLSIIAFVFVHKLTGENGIDPRDLSNWNWKPT